MCREKSVVITMYGSGNTVDRFKVKLMHDSDASYYCDTVNALKLDGDSWVCAKCVSEDSQHTMRDFIPESFDRIAEFDDKSIQRVLREVDTHDLAVALKCAAPQIQEKIFRNMSSGAAGMLKEDMEYMGALRKKDVAEAQERIFNVVRAMLDTGELLYPEDAV